MLQYNIKIIFLKNPKISSLRLLRGGRRHVLYLSSQILNTMVSGSERDTPYVVRKVTRPMYRHDEEESTQQQLEKQQNGVVCLLSPLKTSS
jgi:hypothetical protein